MTTLDIDNLRLSHGSHGDRHDGVCLLEAAAWLAGEPHSDHPACVSPVLAALGRRLNDSILDSRSGQPGLEPRLRALIPRLLGTAGRPDLDQRAGLLAADWLVRVSCPEWLDLAGLTSEAAELRALPEVVAWSDVPRERLWQMRQAVFARRSEARQRLRAADAADADAADADAADADAAAAAYAAAYAATYTAAPYTATYTAAPYTARARLAPVVARQQRGALALLERMVALWGAQ